MTIHSNSRDIRSELVGAMIKRPTTIPDTVELLGFKDPLGGAILSDTFRAIHEVYEAKEVIGLSVVIRAVSASNPEYNQTMLESVLSGCMELSKNISKIPAFVEEIRESLMAGRIRATVAKIAQTDGEAHVSADGMMDELIACVDELNASVMAKENLETTEGMGGIWAELAVYRETGEIPLIKCGINSLDRKLGGFGNGEYICISAMNGGGKSALATSMMLYMSKPIVTTAGDLLSKGEKTGFISLEMTKIDLTKRLLHQVYGLDVRRSMAEGMNAADLEIEVHKAEAKLKIFNLDIVNPRTERCGAIKNICRTMYQRGAKCIFIDYFQLITASGFKSNKTAELEFVSDEFRKLAKELDIPIVMLAQQNSSAKQFKDARGNTSGGVSREHISHCKKIARDCHTVILINEDMDKLIIDKSRSGPTGDVGVEFCTKRLVFRGEEVDKGASPVDCSKIKGE